MKVTHTTRRLIRQRRAARTRQTARDSYGRGPMSREKRADGPEPWQLRRWESADTHRLNRAHWQGAFGRTINEDLLDRLETLRIRSEFEIANDPILEGVVSTFANDVVGPAGPRVQVDSDNEEYNKASEESIEEYHERPDPTRDSSMADVLRLDVRGLCSAGEFIHQFATMRRRGPFEFAIRSIHPRRLETPIDRAGDPLMFMGLQLREDSFVERYHFRVEPPGMYARSTPQWKPVDAQNIQHRFVAHEPDQLRGFPWISVSLDDMADRRDLNKFVMESAKNAAAQGVYWSTNNIESQIDFRVENFCRPIEPGMEQTGPPGYEPHMLQPTQPGAQWREFDNAKLRGYGRPFGMPLMMVLLSSEGNSFSGANHDGQIYIRTVVCLQSWLGTGTLAPQYNQIGLETANTRGIKRPRRIKYTLTWVKPPHPDPKKMYESLRMQLEDGSIDLAGVCAALDRDFDTVQAARKYVQDELTTLELPLPPVNLGHSNGRPASQLRDIADGLDATESNAPESDQQEPNGPSRQQPAIAVR